MKKKVVTSGTFDIIHPGHIFVLREMAKLGSLYVMLTSDRTVFENKGYMPCFNQDDRAEILSAIRHVDGVIKAPYHENNYQTVLDLEPDIYAFGYDQMVPWLMGLIQYAASKHYFMQYAPIIEKYGNNHSSTIKEAIKNEAGN